MRTPEIIQGGMGVGVSNWRLAREVSRAGQLGVVSGTGLNSVFVRRLRQGEPVGDLLRACARFPFRKVAERVLDTYRLKPGENPGGPFPLVPLAGVRPTPALQQLTALASFVEVFLAKEGHEGQVGINFLEKLQLSNLPGIYGAMLAGVDYVLMGAGIPREIPGVLDRFAQQQEASLRVTVQGESAGDEVRVSFDPAVVFPGEALAPLKRPDFLAIIASTTLAIHLARKSTGKLQGFVIEGPTAGGHNAPPRGEVVLNSRGEPVYGAKDEVDLGKIRELGLPFWLAGSYASPAKLREARAAGAAGVQVGTAFAFCRESGVVPKLKDQVIRKVTASGGARIHVFTDPQASPTDYPFKVVPLEETLSEEGVYAARPRRCDLGYLRQTYRRPDGTVGYRCPGEPLEDYLRKDGQVEDTRGRKCLCNSLMANIGLGQLQAGDFREPPLLTAGDDLDCIGAILGSSRKSYSAGDVIQYLLGAG